ncbi:hypothetical protein LPMP_050600 [Leishmania panamensis]|uniref:Ubiquitin-like domain-containing protein n=1 Tax=Leishmania panamensis TaxID=5679 RepID=A0A088RHP4_LEIPA|nr:hypothetical protein LPMP_050600 [Leishmania panamensis]AIN95502.1 hypothetical protein LPMP_050600 [Leishmania panamensis]
MSTRSASPLNTMSTLSSRRVSTASLSFATTSCSVIKRDEATVSVLTSSKALTPSVKQRVEAILRHGSPCTRGLHSISPLAPDAARAPPVELQGPPRYLRARGLTPPAAAEATGRRETRQQQQQQQQSEQDGGHWRSSSCRRDNRRRSSHSQAKSKRGMAQAASPPQSQPPDAANNVSQPPKMHRMTAPLQESGLSLSLPSKHRHHYPSDHQYSNHAQPEAQRLDRTSQLNEGRGTVEDRPELVRAARAPPPRSRSPASRRDSTLFERSDPMAAMTRPPFRGGNIEDMALVVPRLSPSHAAPLTRTRSPQSAARQQQQHLSQRPLQVGISGRFGVPGKNTTAKGSTAAEMTPSAAQHAAALSTFPPLASTSPILRSYIAESFSSYLPGESTVLLGAHHRGKSTPHPASSPPPSPSQAASPHAEASAATSMTAVEIEVAVASSTVSSLPEPAVLARYEEILRDWRIGNSNSCSGGTPHYNGHDAQHTGQLRYTDEEFAAAFDLIVHIRLAAGAVVTVSEIKDEVERRTGLPAAQQSLVYDAMSLQDCLPIHLLLLAADEDDVDTNCHQMGEWGAKHHTDGGVSARRDAVMGGRRRRGCLRLVCVPLSSDSAAAATVVRRTRQVRSPLRAAASPAAAATAVDFTAFPTRSSAFIGPTRAASAAAAVAVPTSPPRRPGAVPFTLSHGTTIMTSATGLSSAAATSASPAALTGNTEQVLSEHISRLRRLYLPNEEISNTLRRGGWASAGAGVERAPEHTDPSVTAMAAVPQPKWQQQNLLSSAPTAYQNLMMNGGGGAAPIRGPLLPHRTELSEALIAALPAPPVRRSAALPSADVTSANTSNGGISAPYASIKTLSWKPSVPQTLPSPLLTRQARISTGGDVDADGDDGNGGGVDASWMSSLSFSSSSAAAAAAALMV